MICERCGYSLEKTTAYCPECRFLMPAGYIIIFVSLFVASYAIGFIPFMPLPLAALAVIGTWVTIITAKIKHPKSLVITVLFWVYLGFYVLSIVLSIILFAVAIATCGFTLAFCADSCPN